MATSQAALDDQLHPVTGNGTPCRRRKSSLSANHSPRQIGFRRTTKSKKVRSLLRRSWSIPFFILLAFGLVYALNPTESNIVHRFMFMSYKVENDDGPAQYGKGRWDFAFVCFYTVFLSFTREFIMHEILRPVASACGIKSKGKQSRFMEQMYTAVYISFMGPLGLYCMKRSPVWYFNTRGMYEAYPHKVQSGELKFYYLVQAAFWTQQAIVMLLGMEKRRKDFKELVAHHIVTIALIFLSYRFHFTYMGIAIYITHDISDWFLALSKSLNYLDSPLQAYFFALCVISWIYLRNYINLRILYSILTDYRTIGPYGIVWETEQYKGPLSTVITFTLLALLQLLNIFWLYLLLRIAYRFVVQGHAKDDRSEDEESEVDTAKLDSDAADKAEALPLDGNSARALPTKRRKAKKT